MSRGMRLSVLGLYQYDSGLFSAMVFPSGMTDEEKQTVVQNILADCAEFEVLYPSWSTMHDMIGIWSKLNISVWERIFTASKLEYNPIENYNRTENETITNDKSETHSGNDVSRLSGSDSSLSSGSNTETNSGTDTNTNKVAAYDSGNLYTHDSSDLLHGHVVSDSSSGSSSTTYGKTDTLTHGEIITHDDEITRENHTSGNIGVTTSQQMLEQEIEVAAKLNVMKMIVESFKERFCLTVY